MKTIEISLYRDKVTTGADFRITVFIYKKDCQKDHSLLEKIVGQVVMAQGSNIAAGVADLSRKDRYRKPSGPTGRETRATPLSCTVRSRTNGDLVFFLTAFSRTNGNFGDFLSNEAVFHYFVATCWRTNGIFTQNPLH